METTQRVNPLGVVPGNLFPGASHGHCSPMWCVQWLMGLTDVGVASHSCFYFLPKGWAAIQKNLHILAKDSQMGQ